MLINLDSWNLSHSILRGWEAFHRLHVFIYRNFFAFHDFISLMTLYRLRKLYVTHDYLTLHNETDF